MSNNEKSEVSRVPWYAEILMLWFLIEVFYFSFNKAREFREVLVENGQTDLLIWGFGFYFVFRSCVFAYMFVLGRCKMYISRKERDSVNQNK